MAQSLVKEFTKGLWAEIPPFRLVLGLCPTLAVTKSVENGLGMGIATTFVLVFSNLLISLLRNVIPSKVRIACYIVIVATFVTIVELLMQAYTYELFLKLGIFIPLIVVNCIIMGRVEAFASKQKPLTAIFDALGMGLGYTWVMIAISAVRELLGNGSLAGIPVMPASYQPILFFILPPGGFLVFGLFISFNIWLKGRMEKSAKERA